MKNIFALLLLIPILAFGQSNNFNVLDNTSLAVSGGSINGTTIGVTTASTAAFTTLSASSTVSGTGFSAYLASPPAIGTTAAAAGKFTTLQATSTITPSSTAGIVGTTTNDNANAGSVGESPAPTNLTNVSLSSGTSANVSSISLTAGDWEVMGSCNLTPAGSTTTSIEQCSVSLTSATMGALGTNFILGAAIPAGIGTTMSTPIVRVLLASTTTVYVVTNASFAVSTMTANGSMFVRRSR